MGILMSFGVTVVCQSGMQFKIFTASVVYLIGGYLGHRPRRWCQRHHPSKGNQAGNIKLTAGYFSLLPAIIYIPGQCSSSKW